MIDEGLKFSIVLHVYVARNASNSISSDMVPQLTAEEMKLPSKVLLTTSEWLCGPNT